MKKIKNAPFLRTNTNTSDIMIDVLIALIPVSMLAVFKFGFFSLLMIVVGIGSAVGFEYLFQKFTNKKVDIKDYSAAVTGLLVALSYPVTAPIWIVILGSFLAIVVAKQLPGGMGKNTFNPAVFSRVLIKILFTPIMTQWVTPYDLVSTATPLSFIGNGQSFLPENVPSMMDAFMGNIGGGIGETTKWAILIGFVYLVYKKVIHPGVPIASVVGLFLATMLFGKSNLEYALYHLVTGTFLFAAVFMVTDYTTGPLNPKAKIYYALAIGALTGILRFTYALPGGVGIAILIMNLAAPTFDAFTTPRVFGHESSSIIYENRN